MDQRTVSIPQVFGNRRNFWIAQLSGWAIFAFGNCVIQGIIGLPALLVFFNSFYSALAGIAVSTIYHALIRRVNWTKWKISHLLIFILCSALVLSAAWLLAVSVLFAMTLPEYQVRMGEILANLVNGGLVFLIWNLIYFFFQYFSKYHFAEVEKWQLAATAREAQLDTLKAQIKPHFVFNTLNNIKALILEEPERAREMLVHFSDLFRYSLLHSGRSLVVLEEEVELLKQYLALLSIQFESRLRYQIEVDSNLLDHHVPPMLLQLLVENAVKHGIAQIPEGGTLEVALFEQDDMLLIEVKNSGSLQQTPESPANTGLGLRNIHNRLQLQYGGSARLEIFEKADNVIAQVKLPLK